MPFQLSLEAAPGASAATARKITLGQQGVFRIGRQTDMDWVLPDPSCAVSSHHCEIRATGALLDLHDLSTNGTFVNGAAKRMAGPHRLADGDRFAAGPYVVAVAIAAEIATGDPTQRVQAARDDDDRTQIVRPTEPSPTLTVRVTSGEGSPTTSKAMRSPGTLVIGRDPAADIVLPDPAGRISRRHGEIRFDAQGCVLHHLSANGIFRATGERLETGSPLQHADTLRIGGFMLTLEVDPAGAPAKRAAAAPPRRGDDPAMMVAAPPAAATAQPAAETTAIAKPAMARPAAPPAPKASPGAPPGEVDPLLARVAGALGLAPADIATADPAALAEQLAGLVAIAAGEMRAMLAARAETLRTGRVVGAAENNPLQFFPTTEEALRTLFGPPRRAYLDANRAFRQIFAELRDHDAQSATAMRAAAQSFAGALAPAAIVRDAGRPRLLPGSRKAQLWDLYVARWSATVGDAADPAAAFERLFAREYQDARLAG